MEKLLRGEVRARLPLGQQVLLYLDPFALFKDASRGPASMRERALSYNRAMRWMLVPYMRRWILIAASLFAAVTPLKALPAAALAVGCCIAVAITAITVAVYLLLGRSTST